MNKQVTQPSKSEVRFALVGVVAAMGFLVIMLALSVVAPKALAAFMTAF